MLYDRGHIPGQIPPHIKRTPIPERIPQRYKKEEASGDVSFYTQYRLEYLIIMRFVGEPRCHMTAIGKAFILRDFFRHILTKQRIGKLRQEIENEMVIDAIVRIDEISSYAAVFKNFCKVGTATRK